jgi:subtilase family serine protease
MKHRVLPFLVAAGLVASLTVASAGASLARSGVSPMFTMDKTPTVAAGVTAPGSVGYGLRTCQVGLSIGQCYDPYQMRTAYGVDKLIAAGFDGNGKTIVIIDAFQSPNIVSQLDTFDSYYGLTAMNGGPGTPTFTQVAPDGLTPFVPGDPNMTGWAEEISLDVLWAHAIAPGANITLVLAKSNQDADILSATKYAVDHRLGDVISQSFGEAETCVDPTLLVQEHQVFAEATAKGMTLVASSGDQGVLQPTCDGSSWIKAASSPASDPLVTAVGGTELHAADYCLIALGCDPAQNPGPGTWLSEVVWNEGAPYGDFQDVFGVGTLATGGGFSVLYKEPSYQKATLPGGKQLGVPDVAYNAAVLHGVLTYLDIPGLAAGWYRFGGTSAGSPQWSAITAIADQMAGHDLGFLNAAIYRAGKSPSYGATFHDITSGTNSSLEINADGVTYVDMPGYSAGPGWDATTGFGTPKTGSIVSYLVHHVSAGDGTAAIAGSMPKPAGKSSVPGHVMPH